MSFGRSLLSDPQKRRFLEWVFTECNVVAEERSSVLKALMEPEGWIAQNGVEELVTPGVDVVSVNGGITTQWRMAVTKPVVFTSLISYMSTIVVP